MLLRSSFFFERQIIKCMNSCLFLRYFLEKLKCYSEKQFCINNNSYIWVSEILKLICMRCPWYQWSDSYRVYFSMSNHKCSQNSIVNDKTSSKTPPCSPNWPPLDLWLFPKRKTSMKRQICVDRRQITGCLKTAFEKWSQRWHNCIWRDIWWVLSFTKFTV